MSLTLKDYRNRNVKQLELALNTENKNKMFWIRSSNNATDSFNRNRYYNEYKKSKTLIKRIKRVLREKYVK